MLSIQPYLLCYITHQKERNYMVFSLLREEEGGSSIMSKYELVIQPKIYTPVLLQFTIHKDSAAYKRGKSGQGGLVIPFFLF